MKATTTVTLARESLYLPLDRLVDEMLATIADLGIFSRANLRLLGLHILLSGLSILVGGTKMGGRCKVLTLVEMSEVWCILINRLGAFL